MNLTLDSFRFDERSGVYLHPESVRNGFDYSDGREVEERILRILKETKDHSLFSRELGRHITDWPTEYHFSPRRHNLLRHYRFAETDQVLELGCGCGAITRQLGESGAKITAVEGSLLRAQCAAERCRDLSNVTVYCSNFQDLTLKNEYNYVTLIGVFEYSGAYFKGDDPFKQCLEIIKSGLRKDGKLIIAIENRLGLKYFLGYSEDHTGTVYEGLQDFYGKNAAFTFGKQEITDILVRNGFPYINFAYPFPDYKIPKAVIFEPAFAENTVFSVSELVSQIRCRDYSHPNRSLPDETFIWRQLEKNRLLKDLSNSFLIEASANDCGEKDQSVLAKYYTVDRKREFNTETSFTVKDDSNIEVMKKRIDTRKLINNNSILLHVLTDAEYIAGHSLDFYLNKSIATNRFSSFVEYFRLWLDYIVSNGLSQVNTENIYSSIIKDEFIDAKPKNLIFKNGALVSIDSEWKYKQACTVYTLIIRYLRDINLAFIHENIPGDKDPIWKLFDYLNIQYNSTIYEQYVIVANIITDTVYDDCRSVLNGNYPQQKESGFDFTHKARRVLQRIKNRISR